MAWEYAAGHALYHLLVFLLLSSHAVSLIWNITHKLISSCEKRDANIMCRVVSTFAVLIFTTGRAISKYAKKNNLASHPSQFPLGLIQSFSIYVMMGLVMGW